MNKIELDKKRIEEDNYWKLKDEFSSVASIALWEDALDDGGPKSNLDNMAQFTDENLLKNINTNFVFFGLNEANHDETDDTKRNHQDWGNFHSAYNRGMDYKLRGVLKGSEFEGAYLTDVFKDYPETNSNKVKGKLSEDDIQKMKREVELIGGRPILIGMGGKAYNYISGVFGDEYTVAHIYHYSYASTGNDEEYLEHIRMRIIEAIEKDT